MPIETIRYVVTGANPATSSIQVTFGADGTGTGTITLTGTNSGVDTLQAFLDTFSLSSNQAQVVWQGPNGPISISPIQAYFAQGNGSLPTGLTAASFSAPQTFNSLMFNTHPQSLLPGDPHESGNQANPMVNNAITASGAYSGDVAVAGDTGGGILLSLVGSFVVSQAGQVTFSAYDNAFFVIGCPGASFVSGVQTLGSVATTPVNGYSTIAGRNGNWPGGNTATDVFTLSFPSPGVYPFEIYFASGVDAEREFCLLANNAVIPPASMVAIPPAPAAGSGQMVLTPNSAGPDITGTTQVFTIQISGLSFDTQPYIPLLEGTTGYLLVANDAGDNNYTFPTLPNGGSVNPSLAASSVFSLVGNNASWVNRIGLQWNGTNFILNYNGSSPDSRVESTTLTIENSDIAWFNPQNNTFDVYGVSGQGGGSQAEVLVYWLVSPTIGSVSPATLNADGGTYQLVITFANPLPPIQNNTQVQVVLGAGMTQVSSITNFDSDGWMLGVTVTLTTAVSATTQSSSVSVTVSGNLTYLSGSAFVTETVTFVNGQQFPLSLAGTGQATVTTTYGGTTLPSTPTPVSNCPAVEMLLGDGAPVGTAVPGYLADCLSENYQAVERHPIEAVAFAYESCTRLVTGNEAEIVISDKTPVPTVEVVCALANGAAGDGLPLYASDIRPGMHLFTDIDGHIEISPVLIAESAGTRRVGHISLGGRNFAAGRDSRRRVYTHNIRIVAVKE